MYTVTKRIEIACAHCLEHLDYESKCKKIHGHNFIITVHCRSKELNKNGMVIDFTEIKKIVNIFDHGYINDYLDCPTAETLAQFICESVPFCFKVEVQESEGNVASYEKEE